MSTNEQARIELATEDSPDATTPTQAVATGPAVSAVSIKLPPFWPSDPEIWFVQVEAHFSTRNITSQKSKFEYLVSSLSPEIATEVRDLLIQPPADAPYDRLKAELVKRTAASVQLRLQQLISGEVLGDQKPTQLLRHMQQLLGDHATEANQGFLRELFLQRLPANVRMVLACGDASLSLTALADMADKVMEVANPTISAVTQPQVPPPHPDIISLQEQVSKLTELVTALSERRSRRGRSLTRRNRPQSDSRAPGPAPIQQDNDMDGDGLCWYHHRYGETARRCRKPCRWGNE